MTTIDPSYSLEAYREQKNKTGSSALGKDDFLKLLITQLQNQDPSSPMDDTQFISQMATFSSLEQMTNMNSNLENLIDLQKQNSQLTYSQLAGKEVVWQKITEDQSGNKTVSEGTGIISSIQFNGEDIFFYLEDGTKLEPANISEVKSSTTGNSIQSASQLIGMLVTYLNSDNEEKEAVVSAVQMKKGKTQLILNDGANTAISADQITKISKQ